MNVTIPISVRCNNLNGIVAEFYYLLVTADRHTVCWKLEFPWKITAERETLFPKLLIYFINCSWVANRWQQHSTHLNTNSTQNNTMKQNTHNGTYIAIRIRKHNNKDSQFTKVNRSTQTYSHMIKKWNLKNIKEYDKGKAT